MSYMRFYDNEPVTTLVRHYGGQRRVLAYIDLWEGTTPACRFDDVREAELEATRLEIKYGRRGTVWRPDDRQLFYVCW